MVHKNIDAQKLRLMFTVGARNLEANKVRVDALNVFPVPDGDTGTNMNLTLQAVLKAFERGPADTLTQIVHLIASGSLMGARGNSGVILSQLFRGFSRYLDKKETIDAKDFANALAAGVDTAYRAVGRPVEGTILTVAKESAKAAQASARASDNLVALMENVVRQAEKTLAKTPDMLPVLKRAGVVDAGGQGLVYVYRGFLAVLQGVEIEAYAPALAPPLPLPEAPKTAPAAGVAIEFLYCTEFLLIKPAVDEMTLRSALESHGDSLLVVGDNEIIKVHVHTNHPGLALEVAMEYGELSGIKIENMKEQHEHTHWAEAMAAGPSPGEGKRVGLVAVVAGPGLAEVYRSLGVDLVVEGGQTMNPSTEDLGEAVDRLACTDVIILPNNKNIVMAAEQVRYISSKSVHVVASHTIPQGLAALLSYEPEPESIEKMVADMQRRMKAVKTGQVTYAVKTYQSDVGEVNKDDILGLADGEISAIGSDISKVSLALLDSMVTQDDGVISLFYGDEVSEPEARALADTIEERFPRCQLDFCNGGQPFYYYIFSVE